MEDSMQNKSILKKFFATKETPVFLIIIGISIVMSIASPYFLTFGNISATLVGLATEGMVVIGMTIILAMGGLDLSVGSVMGLTSMTAAMLFSNFGVNIFIASIIGLLIGCLCGIINGILIGKAKMAPFIVTLAMMSIAKGITMLATEGSAQSIPGVTKSFLYLGQGKVFGIPVIVLIFLVFAVAGHFFLRKTELFRKVFYIGSNEKAASLSGINVEKIKIIMYVLVGFLSAVGGILSLSRFGSCTPTTGQGVEMRAISAAVIGGASLNGGEGTIMGAGLGILLLNIVNNGLILLNVSVYGQDLISGLILLIAVMIDTFSHMNKANK